MWPECIRRRCVRVPNADRDGHGVPELPLQGFNRIVRRAFAQGRRVSPHCLRHPFASLHIARGTDLLSIQEAGGCASARAGPDKDVRAVGLEFYESFEIGDVKVHLCALWRAESVRRLELCRLELV